VVILLASVYLATGFPPGAGGGNRPPHGPQVVLDADAVSRERGTGRGTRHNGFVRIERLRENVFTVTATSQELSALVAGARMALEAMRAAPEPPPQEAVEILEGVLREFDLARERLAGGPTGDG
jgi:hypothetical protein